MYLVLVFGLLIQLVLACYWSDRNQFIKNEEKLAVGGFLQLSNSEKLVNKYLMLSKTTELEDGFLNPEKFPPARHFFHAKKDIENSLVYQFISEIPKGGLLHVHHTAISSIDYIIDDITYRENLFICVSGENVSLKFFETSPNTCWKSVREVRQKMRNFDRWLSKKLNLVTDKPYKTYPDVNTVWKAFKKIFETTKNMLTYRPVFEDYFYNSLKELYLDNVNYIEVRSTFSQVYELNGTVYQPAQILGILKNVVDRFLLKYPNFIGVKFIYAPLRFVNNRTMDKYIQTYKDMKNAYPEFLVGFDLVGQEDKGKPLYKFVDQLKNISEETKFYFHAGETKWNGMSPDLNLVDAVLLNATRIGHGFSLIKHPIVLKEIKKKQIAIEINPISNQVLNLVKDLRNHPANYLISKNYPVVISSDDPGLWGASGLSHDFYQTFMGMTSKNADIRLLKQLAINSITYSSLNNIEKIEAKQKFLCLWDCWIEKTASDLD